MILYHAGPQWAQIFEADLTQSELATRLCTDHGFVRGALYEPFGPGRGAVVAQRDHMLVMALCAEGNRTWFSVAPSKEIQDLLWSFSNGYASQWSPLELKAISGCEDWGALQQRVHKQFAQVVRSVERAIHGAPEHDAAPEMPSYDGDVLEVPSDYLASMTGEEVIECAH
ncbi:hypothetical protein [Cupriavidus numazuensis]|uniref:Uncharacterized protein n=1 Tax=Cupriavidus numazuensis TaxID=221992 RepID=A0ABM8TTH8_9BURK|nr:hypothetical protein [Cupriavidus numazuensis]CAG2159767.1 hypothetical protein LMG26411_06963 [Cupriavidus numazuensis]